MESKMGFRLFPSSVSEYSTLGVNLAVNKPVFLHCPVLGGQNLLGHIAYGLFQLPEPLRSRHQVTQNQHLPLMCLQRK